MKDRTHFTQSNPAAYRAMLALQRHASGSGLEPRLLDLVKLCASYQNGCAYCVDMHSKEARAAGETEQRIYAVPVWRETPFFTQRERIALAWTEAVTDIADTRVDDDLYEAACEHFTEAELVDLTLAVIAINGWNRLAITFRSEAGTYRVAPAGAGA